jgi:TPP-dependent pyruvate/acetoin dehydrogenase alpha subunit
MTETTARDDREASLGLSTDGLLELYRRMLEIRFFEEEVMRLFARGLVRASTHLYQGQEAVAVGACAALRQGDTMTCTYRGHGAVLAMGARIDRAMAEILGKADGLCAGKGGSMHLTDLTVGALGSFAIVGAHLPFACGTALAAQYHGTGAVSACFFGDGATNIGAFHEALNLAAVWKLPIIFICENNLYGEYSPIASTTPIDHLADRAAAYAIPAQTIDGNDVLAMRATVLEACVRARAGEGPAFIEAKTYRHVGHSRSDPGTYRPPGELETWLKQDPIDLFGTRLRDEHDVDPRQLEAVRDQAQRRVADETTRVESWPEPEPGSRFDDLWVTA